MRKVPTNQVIRVNVPEEFYTSSSTLTPEQFTELIWNPLQQALEERKLTDKIIAVIYSCDFPIRVSTEPAMSLTGMTFVRNEIPKSAVINQGLFNSVIFAGPLSKTTGVGKTRTFADLQKEFPRSMPLPSMMLGYVQQNGNTVDEVLASLKRGVKSDRSKPRGIVYLAINDDVRSKCRAPWYEDAATEIRKNNKKSGVLMDQMMPKEEKLIGFMTGNATVPTLKATFLPGAYADHLTSYGGSFDAHGQTKISTWIRQGATATSGTVVEPYAIAAKFPNAFIFLHQQRGVTMIEAIYLATRSPLQLLVLGEPLANPWGK